MTTGDSPLSAKKLVGLVTYGAGGMPGATLVTMDTATAQKLFTSGGDVFQQLWVVADPGVSPSTLRDRVNAVLPAGVQALTGGEAAEVDAGTINKALRFVTAALWVFAATSLLAGGFLIANTFAMLITQRARELALLRALGASKAQIRRTVLLEALVIGVVGTAGGLLAGYVLARVIRHLFSRFGYDLSATPWSCRGAVRPPRPPSGWRSRSWPPISRRAGPAPCHRRPRCGRTRHQPSARCGRAPCWGSAFSRWPRSPWRPPCGLGHRPICSSRWPWSWSWWAWRC
ncbi:ABC transporter permease [Branchiibius cervicis]|uniref:ABC transporter permease n=1 Tax=Branchiibius cervicis TaxID=908252 RepID=A0ABW2AVL1_9MICO